MPIDSVHLIVDLQDDDDTTEEEGYKAVVAYDLSCFDLLCIVDVSCVSCCNAWKWQVHANDSNADDEATKALLQLDLPSKAEVGGQQENEADHTEKWSIDGRAHFELAWLLEDEEKGHQSTEEKLTS